MAGTSTTATSPDWDSVARTYTELLLDRRRVEAAHLVTDLLDEGADVRDVYLEVFEASQREIGRRWQANEITVALEHYCTAVTQQHVASLYPRIFAAAQDGRRAVVACASAELHELGARMVADFLQLDGWDAIYLGANVPADDILAEVEATDADLLGLSVALPDKVPVVDEVIARLRRELARPVRVVVGGRPFSLAPGLWERVDADGTAPDARGAVELANRLVPSEGSAS